MSEVAGSTPDAPDGRPEGRDRGGDVLSRLAARTGRVRTDSAIAQVAQPAVDDADSIDGGFGLWYRPIVHPLQVAAR